jgi:hypothetical protein
MPTSPSLTLLDLAFSVLVENDRPLTAEEISAVAGEAGYWASPEEIQYELDSYLLNCPYQSPIIPVGNTHYGLLERLNPSPAASISVRAAIGLAAVILLVVVGLWRILPAGRDTIPSAPRDRASPPASSQTNPPVADSALPASQVDAAWWSANAINQLNDDTQRIARKFLSNPFNTCGPAVLAVITNYWRAQAESSAERVTPGEVIKSARNQLGYFYPPYNSGLLDFKGLRAIGGLYGLSQAFPDSHRSLMTVEELLARVQAGEPAIVGMRYHYQGPERLYLPSGGSGGYNHFVIVFEALQENGQTSLRVFNPHPGYYLTGDEQAAPGLLTLEEFVQSWTINDGSEHSDYGYAGFFRLDP